jgi:hypothetical protein
MPTDIARYSIELFKLGGEGAGIEEILDRHADLKIARSIYRTRVEEYPGRLIMLCDHARVLARSDQHARTEVATTRCCFLVPWLRVGASMDRTKGYGRA